MIYSPVLSLNARQEAARGFLDPRWTFARASTATQTKADGTLATVAANVPRFDFRTLAGESYPRPALLLETGTTNQVQTNVAAFNESGATTSGYAGVLSPTSAQRHVQTGSGRIGPTCNTLAAGGYTFSLWLRGAVGGEQVTLSIFIYSDTLCVFKIVQLSTAWQRFSVTAEAAPTGINRGACRGVAGQTFFTDGWQLEAGARASSYLAPATNRAADSLSMPLCQADAQPIPAWNPTAATVLCDFVLPVQSGGSLGWTWSMSSGALWRGSFAANGYMYFQGGGADITVGAPEGTRHRVAIAWGPTSASVSVDGATPATGPGLAQLGPVATVNLGADFNGNTGTASIYDFALWPMCVPDLVLQQLSAQARLI